jgi:hypothetical protein
VAISGVADQTTGAVTKMAYVGGLIWQENIDQLWWSKTAATSAWAPPDGTATAPVNISITNLSTGSRSTIDATAPQSLNRYGDAIQITTPGTANVTLGASSTSLEFVATNSVSVTAGSGSSTLVLGSGKGQFTSGAGAMTVTGGSGADAYFYAAGNSMLTVNDFSLASGDSLTISRSLQASLTEIADNKGGVYLKFGQNTSQGIHLTSTSSLASTQIHWA